MLEKYQEKDAIRGTLLPASDHVTKKISFLQYVDDDLASVFYDSRSECTIIYEKYSETKVLVQEYALLLK